MKRLIIGILIFGMCAASAHAVNLVDQVLCKHVILRYNGKHVLVNRISGEVKYVLRDTGQWIIPSGQYKNQLQLMYDAQKPDEKGPDDF